MADMQASSTPEELHMSDLTRRWLLCYYRCCQGEAEEAHATVLSRVIPAIETAITTTTYSTTSPSEKLQPGVKLDLSGLYMTLAEWSAALRSFAQALPLQVLTLRNTNMGDAGLRSLSREMSAYGGSTLVDTAKETADLVRRTSSARTFPLTSLDLCGCGLTDASPLSLVVTLCPALRSLDLANNHLGSSPTGLAVLCTALRLHACVESVNLSDNGIRGVRGGAVMAGLAELIVTRSLDAVDASTDASVHDTSSNTLNSPAVKAAGMSPLRSLNLSHNLLGCYYLVRGCLSEEAVLAELTRGEVSNGNLNIGSTSYAHNCRKLGAYAEKDGLALFRDCVYEAGERNLTSCGNGSATGGAHETVTAFPLVTALYLNNSLLQLDLADNGLPDTLMEYVEAKLHVNCRTHQTMVAVMKSASEARNVFLGSVKEVLHDHLLQALQQVQERAAQKANATTAREGSFDDEKELSCNPDTAHWTSAEVQKLLRDVLQSLGANLSTL